MGVYIKGIEMPKACSDCFAERCIGSDFGCDILGFDDANTTCFTNERREDCPLIEILPHGKLIDADALYDLLVNLADNEYTPKVFASWLSHEENAPTIISTDKEENE